MVDDHSSQVGVVACILLDITQKLKDLCQGADTGPIILETIGSKSGIADRYVKGDNYQRPMRKTKNTGNRGKIFI